MILNVPQPLQINVKTLYFSVPRFIFNLFFKKIVKSVFMKKKKQDKDHPYSSDQHSLHSVSESLDATIPVAAKPPSVTSTNDSSLPSIQQGVSVKKKKVIAVKLIFFRG